MYQASLEHYRLNFKQPSGTSRGVLTEKHSWFIRLWNVNDPETVGIGEASIIKTLSPEWNEETYIVFLEYVVENINSYINEEVTHQLTLYPSIQCALETALRDLKNGGKGVIYPSEFTENKARIPINGLIWMGEKEFMLSQIQEKLAQGFDCIKLKIGAIDFQAELELLKYIRRHHSAEEIELRVDANGAFSPEDALKKLTALSQYDLHSIEQPIKQGQWKEMQDLCRKTPLPIALDEELISVVDLAQKKELLDTIQPKYIILKPSLVGGFIGTDEWIRLAEERQIQWWITSALESNVGLNAIAQYTFTKNNPLPQGLGTGQLYTNNTPSALTIEKGQLYLDSV